MWGDGEVSQGGSRRLPGAGGGGRIGAWICLIPEPMPLSAGPSLGNTHTWDSKFRKLLRNRQAVGGRPHPVRLISLLLGARPGCRHPLAPFGERRWQFADMRRAPSSCWETGEEPRPAPRGPQRQARASGPGRPERGARLSCPQRNGPCSGDQFWVEHRPVGYRAGMTPSLRRASGHPHLVCRWHQRSKRVGQRARSSGGLFPQETPTSRGSVTRLRLVSLLGPPP